MQSLCCRSLIKHPIFRSALLNRIEQRLFHKRVHLKTIIYIHNITRDSRNIQERMFNQAATVLNESIRFNILLNNQSTSMTILFYEH